jgi:hypothetical protein
MVCAAAAAMTTVSTSTIWRKYSTTPYLMSSGSLPLGSLVKINRCC